MRLSMHKKWDERELLINMVRSSDLLCEFGELSTKLRRSVKLDHLFALTDHNALFQHAKYSLPARREGYTVDDNARALVFAMKSDGFGVTPIVFELQRKLISFLLLMQDDDGRFHNLMDFSQRIIDEPTVADHLGRAIWAAGTVINSSIASGAKSSARLIFDRALPWARASTSPRTKAYACLGLHERIIAEPDESNLRANLKLMADGLVALYNSNRTSSWDWFENILTYDKGRLVQALLSAYQSLREQAYFDVAEASLQFLGRTETIDGNFAPIGNRGWYVKGGTRALYDQQPIEPGAMIEAATIAYKLNRSKLYEEILRQALGWFFGLNTKSVKLYDESTGACYDGITPKGLNENQGAESTLAFLLAAEAFVNAFSQA
jgi:hypothetical protein